MRDPFPYGEGVDAFDAGKSSAENPYPKGSADYIKWGEGFIDRKWSGRPDRGDQGARELAALHGREFVPHPSMPPIEPMTPEERERLQAKLRQMLANRSRECTILANAEGHAAIRYIDDDKKGKP